MKEYAHVFILHKFLQHSFDYWENDSEAEWKKKKASVRMKIKSVEEVRLRREKEVKKTDGGEGGID